jgi:four helix bundle protein
MIKSHKDLLVWQKAIKLVKIIYRATSKMPKSEIYGLVSQMRRAAISIPSNIAEGRQRSSKKEFINFLIIARGSAAELETQIIITKDLYPEIDFKEAEKILLEVKKMLAGIISKLKILKADS